MSTFQLTVAFVGLVLGLIITGYEAANDYRYSSAVQSALLTLVPLILVIVEIYSRIHA